MGDQLNGVNVINLGGTSNLFTWGENYFTGTALEDLTEQIRVCLACRGVAKRRRAFK